QNNGHVRKPIEYHHQRKIEEPTMASDEDEDQYTEDYIKWLDEEAERYKGLGEAARKAGIQIGTDAGPPPSLNEEGSLKQPGVRQQKVKITLDRNASSYNKSNAIQRINRDLGSKATIRGDTVIVQDGPDEKRVIEILNRERIDYSRST